MTISVLMSTYHRERADYLHTALESIWIHQTRRPDQIVLVEDGPLTPQLYQVIEQWKETIGDALTLISNPENKGLAAALNDGINAATGDLIARMDSDDISCPERFAIQERYMTEHPEVDILGGALREFNDAGTLDVIRHYPLSAEEIKATAHRMSPMAHPSVMFRKTFFDAGFRYSSKYHICEDVTMWFDALCAKRIMNNIPDVILNFRRNDSMMTRRSQEKAWSEFHAYNDGIYRLCGPFSTRYIYSFMRLLFRLMPSNVINKLYNSNIRHKIVK